MPKYHQNGYVYSNEGRLKHLCATCEFRTFSKTALKLHDKVTHGLTRSSTPYCGKCDEYFKTPQELRIHSSKHVKRIKCR